MKLLKKILSDRKKYTFSTFSALESINLKKDYKKYVNLQDEQDKIQFELDEKGKFRKDDKGRWIAKETLSEKEQQRLDEIEQTGIDFTMDIFRKSICKNHPEFKKNTNKEEDKKIIEKMLDLVDIEDLKKITSFAFTGSYIIEEKEIIDIPLEIKPEDGK